MVDSRAQVDREAAPLEMLRSQMRSAGVQRAVLAAASPADTYSLEAASRGGDLAVSVPFDPIEPDTLHQLECLLRRFSVSGLRVEARRPRLESWINAPESGPFWEAAQEAELPVELWLRSDQYNQLSDVVSDFPKVPLVIDRLGQGPDTSPFQFLPVVLEYARYPQVHVRVSGLFDRPSSPHPHRDAWDRIRQVRDRFGAERMMWGSEFPQVNRYCGYQEEARLLEALSFLSARELEWIREDTARGIWFASR